MSASLEHVVEELRPNKNKPYVVVHVTTKPGYEAYAHFACKMTDHDFLSLANHSTLPLAMLRALVGGAAYVLTDRKALAALAAEQGRATLTIEPNTAVSQLRNEAKLH